MQVANKVVLGGVLLAVALAMAGCSGEVEDTSSQPEPTYELYEGSIPTETPTPTPTPTPEGITMLGQYADPDGYTGSLTLTLPTRPLSFTSDVTNSKPGKTQLAGTITYSGSLENTTANRSLPFHTTYWLAAIYPGDSTACHIRELGIVPDDISFGKMSSPTNCFLLFDKRVMNAIDIEPNGAHDFEQVEYEQTPVGFKMEGVPEASAPELIQQLGAPLGFAFIVDLNDTDSWSAVCTLSGGNFPVTVASITDPALCG